MNKKTLLVLAASTYQVPVINTAKRIGYRVVTTDNVSSNPGHMLADSSYQVDTTDQEGILALARHEKISGVISPGTDVAVVSAAYVAEKLRLPGPPLDAAYILTHKNVFREFLAKHQFRSPQFFITDEGLLQNKDIFLNKKWIIKPNKSSGSKGVFVVFTHNDLMSYISESRNYSLDGKVILEEFIEGTQHTLEGILKEGKFVLSLITDRDTASLPYTATTGHRVPGLIPSVVQRAILNTIERILASVCIVDGPVDCDFVVNGEQVFILEITPRLGGNSLSSLFKSALNFDLVEYAISYACSDAIFLPQARPINPSAIIILGVKEKGYLSWNAVEAASLQQETWVRHLRFDCPQGAEVMPFINGRYRVGEVLITGESRSEIDARIAEVKQRLALEAKINAC